MHRISIVIVTVIAIAAALVAGSARAAGPVHEWVDIDDTFTWNDCGFPVEERAVAKLHFISWFDESGNRIRELVAAPGSRSTWRNPLTGASVTSPTPYVVHKQDNPDGSVTVAFTGLGFRLTGGGRAEVASGRTLIVFSDGGVEVLSSVGPSADLCEALAATIG